MITEWSFPALDSGLPCKHGAGMRVDTQEQKALCYEIFQRTLFAHPFVIGSDYFMWVDEPALGISSAFPEDSNYGLVNERDEPYETLVRAASQANQQAYAIHKRRLPDLKVEQRGRGFGVVNQSPFPVRARLTLSHNGVASEQDFVPPQPAQAGYHHFALYNPSGQEVSLAPLVVSAAELRALGLEDGLAAVYVLGPEGSAREIPSQVDELPEGREVCALCPQTLPAHAAVNLALLRSEPQPCESPLFYRPREGGFVAGNGRLTLIKEEGDGDLIDRVLLDGQELGKFIGLLCQAHTGDLWVGCDRFEGVKAFTGPARIILDLTASYSGASPAVNEAGERARPFRATYRFTLYPQRDWFSARLIRIENTGTEPLWVCSYYHYVRSNLGGSPEGDVVGGPQVPNYWAPVGMWEDTAADLGYGAVTLPRDGFRCTFWVDEWGNQHPDLDRDVKRQLDPGESFGEAQPEAYIFGSRLAEKKTPWVRVREEARSLRQVRVIMAQ